MADTLIILPIILKFFVGKFEIYIAFYLVNHILIIQTDSPGSYSSENIFV
jgi:hypothetical protein